MKKTKREERNKKGRTANDASQLYHIDRGLENEEIERRTQTVHFSSLIKPAGVCAQQKKNVLKIANERNKIKRMSADLVNDGTNSQSTEHVMLCTYRI